MATNDTTNPNDSVNAYLIKNAKRHEQLFGDAALALAKVMHEIELKANFGEQRTKALEAISNARIYCENAELAARELHQNAHTIEILRFDSFGRLQNEQRTYPAYWEAKDVGEQAKHDPKVALIKIENTSGEVVWEDSGPAVEQLDEN